MTSETESARFSALPVFMNSPGANGSALVVANAHVPFLLYDSLFTANLPIAVSSNASTKLYGFFGAAGLVTNIPRKVVEMIVWGPNRIARGSIEAVEAHFRFGDEGAPMLDGKLLLVYLSRAIFPDRSAITRSLKLYGSELHRSIKENKPDLFYLNFARVLYYCR